MRLVTSSDVQKLTGLTSDQLREWTVRRKLIEPDAKPNGPGTRARFAWQTVLLLRIVVVLKDQFHVELQAHKPSFASLSSRLNQASFPSLRGTAAVLRAGGGAEVVAIEELLSVEGDFLSVALDAHLDVLSSGFGFVEPVRQLPLFPVRAVA